MSNARNLANLLGAGGAFAGNVIAAGTVEPAGDTAAGDNAAIGFTAAEGLILTGQGSTSDIAIKNDADTLVASVATGTTVMNFASAITVGGSALSNTATNAAVTGTVVKGTTSLQTPLIEFTDGDDAIAIADGGIVTLLTTAVSKSEGAAVTTNITQGLCKAWVHIASPTTSANAAITLADSFNTTSMTDNGTGQITMAIANNMGNATYVVHTSCDSDNHGNIDTGTQAAGTVRVEARNYQNDLVNCVVVVSVHGDLA